MKISAETLSILKNFETHINGSILIRKGNNIKTISAGNDIIGEATVQENFPMDFGIYDLRAFLGIISLFEDAELSFGDRSVAISSGNRTYQYRYASPVLIKNRNDYEKIEEFFTKAVPNIEYISSFDISSDNFLHLTKAVSVSGLTDIKIFVKEGKVVFEAYDSKNDSAGNFFIETDQVSDTNFTAYFDIKSLVCIPGNYTISVAENMLHFKNPAGSLNYWFGTVDETEV